MHLSSNIALDETHLALALEVTKFIGTWDWDVPNDRVSANAEFAKLFSVDPNLAAQGAPIGMFFKGVHPDDLPNLQQQVAITLQQGGNFAMDYRLLLQDGSTRWIFAKGNCYLNEDGKPLRFAGVAIDISERKQVAADLKNVTDTAEWQRMVYETALSNTPDLVYIFDLTARFQYANKALLKMWGRSWENAAGKGLRELGYAEWHAEMHEREIEQVIATKKPIRGEVPFTGTNGRRIYDYIFSPVFDAKVEVIAIAGTTRDVTERKQMEERLQESQAHLSLMVESAQDYAIISFNKDGIIKSWNRGAERIFGSTPESMIGQHLQTIYTPEDCAADVPLYELAKAAEQGRATDERWHIRANGERFYASGIMTAMYDANREITGFVKIARDMTAERAAQENLLAARNAAEAANIAKSEFLANISHEIRTPMNAIIGLSNILAMSQPLNERQREYVKTLQLSADAMLSLINDLLDIAKIEAQTVELENIPFNATQVLQEVVSMMAVRVKEKGLEFSSEGECVKSRTFLGDPTRLRQIILNLCSNAVKFTEHGKVHISITCHPTDDPACETICITVADTGIGIAADKLANIFQKFVQADNSINRKYGGTGLGLAITKTLTEIMGGTIQVDSEVGQGTTFTVCIPLKLADSHETADGEASLENLSQTFIGVYKPRILLVEDYAANVLVATTYLEIFGYKVDVASNGLEAYQAIKQNKYAAILMDVQMHGMNGFDATRLIREYEKQQDLMPLPIIGMTAHALMGDRERCLAVGMNNYIAKPFNPEELKDILAEFMPS